MGDYLDMLAAANPATPQRMEELLDFENFAPLLQVRPEEGGTVVPFLMYPEQRAALRRVGDHPRTLFLKSRRFGLTTLFMGLGLHRINTRPYYNTLMTAHRDADATKIFKAADLMHKKLPDWLRQERTRAERREIEYPNMHSSMNIGTAGGAGAGRSDALQLVHMTEMSRYTGDTDSFITGVLEAARAGQVIGESTAHGASGLFYELYMANRDGGEWQTIFLPWWEDHRNTVALTESEVREFAYEEQGEEYARDNHLSPQQVVWHRRKKATVPGRVMVGEYPPDDLTAFAVSGSHFFDQDVVMAHAVKVKDRTRWFTADDGDVKRLPKDLRPAKPGCIIWEPPKEGVRYVIGADPTDGTPKGDPAYLTVNERRSGRQVARLRWRWPPREFAKYANAIGRWYNKALIAGELNRREFVRTLRRKYLYKNLFWHKNEKGNRAKEPGYMTTGQTRPVVLDFLRDSLEGTGDEPGWLEILDPVFFSECTTFEDQGGGRYEANSGKHDDSILAIGIMLQARRQPMPRVRSE